ncbi:DUF2946 family protein [Roseateles sp. BYS180W]|uniref:DUF2946 family protein n=1 Tax=Roseateles rivi TaxID=3299028 RepID=A0ABW7FUC6_9BURK
MDDIVKAALKKWPHVPACYGWLALDARGDWYMRDERTQAAGPFPQLKGSKITHEKLLGFIHRNYLCDARGAWFFQNGPQRVFVQLEAAPHIWRLQAQGDGPVEVHSHTGEPVQSVQQAWLDEHQRLFLSAQLPGLDQPTLGLVHSMDMLLAAQALEQAQWPLQERSHAELLAQFGVLCVPCP